MSQASAATVWSACSAAAAFSLLGCTDPRSGERAGPAVVAAAGTDARADDPSLREAGARADDLSSREADTRADLSSRRANRPNGGDAGADASAATPRGVLHVPRAPRHFVPTGHFRIELWAGAPTTGTLLDPAGKGAVPVSEARLLWADGTLYLFFYAGDLDLQAHITRRDGPTWNDDSVELSFGGPNGWYAVRVSVTGVVTDGTCPPDAVDLADPRCDLQWESGTRAATDYDGKLNDITDRDEEWAVEAAIPLRPLGIGRAAGVAIAARVRRCEIAHDGPRACGTWEGTLVLDDAAPPGRDGGSGPGHTGDAGP